MPKVNKTVTNPPPSTRSHKTRKTPDGLVRNGRKPRPYRPKRRAQKGKQPASVSEVWNVSSVAQPLSLAQWTAGRKEIVDRRIAGLVAGGMHPMDAKVVGSNAFEKYLQELPGGHRYALAARPRVLPPIRGQAMSVQRSVPIKKPMKPVTSPLLSVGDAVRAGHVSLESAIGDILADDHRRQVQEDRDFDAAYGFNPGDD